MVWVGDVEHVVGRVPDFSLNINRKQSSCRALRGDDGRGLNRSYMDWFKFALQRILLLQETKTVGDFIVRHFDPLYYHEISHRKLHG
jgi:hypothetical protein